MSNQIPKKQKQAEELFTVVSNHWSVETTTHVCGMSLKEGHALTKKRRFKNNCFH